jgi:hypothetical protein
MATGSEATKRALSSSSEMEVSIDKRPKTVEEEPPMPSWARQILQEVTLIRNNSNAIMITVNELKHDMGKVKEDVDDMGDRLARLEVRLDAAETKIASCEAENKSLKSANAKLTDDAMRDTLTIHKIPRKGGKETWPDTERILATFLSDNAYGSVAEWLAKITRAHRGKPSSDVIHCLFESWKFAQEVKEIFRKRQGKIGVVFALDKFSIPTQDRRNLCQDKRDVVRRENGGAKLWIKYPATLMCQLPGEEGYKAIATH